MQTISVDAICPIRRQTKAVKGLSGNKRTSPDNRSESETPDRNRVSQASHKVEPPAEGARRFIYGLAKKMLLSTDMPIVSIATKCGFNSQSYFNYIFRWIYFSS